MYYLCSENKGADQLRGYREADLRLCFRLCRLLVFPRGGSNNNKNLAIIESWSVNLPRSLLGENNTLLTEPCHEKT